MHALGVLSPDDLKDCQEAARLLRRIGGFFAPSADELAARLAAARTLDAHRTHTIAKPGEGAPT